ncbi:pyridoxal 5'-phosphate synthase [Marinicella sp. W31]|uniref:pyridoxine/pyridoxamine 5'-phosphate oxidase n=1 Tax=Marinicella sp. W31 TaxID=3023713 RepID=UPI0037572594
MNSNSDPIKRFQLLWDQARESSAVQLKSAVCISTIDENGFPQARFVDLKQADEGGFVFCTDYQSSKGQELLNNPKAALTIWWEHLSTQVRITGTAATIPTAAAEKFWHDRTYDAKLTSLASQQSQELHSDHDLIQLLTTLQVQHHESDIPKPASWGGFVISPIKIEFLLFKEDRMHQRDLYIKQQDHWQKKHLQP